MEKGKNVGSDKLNTTVISENSMDSINQTQRIFFTILLYIF